MFIDTRIAMRSSVCARFTFSGDATKRDLQKFSDGGNFQEFGVASPTEKTGTTLHGAGTSLQRTEERTEREGERERCDEALQRQSSPNSAGKGRLTLYYRIIVRTSSE